MLNRLGENAFGGTSRSLVFLDAPPDLSASMGIQVLVNGVLVPEINLTADGPPLDLRPGEQRHRLRDLLAAPDRLDRRDQVPERLHPLKHNGPARASSPQARD